MACFVLVHGAWHGAWCWSRLTPELVSRGHRVVTLDLPSDDPAATFETYADVVAAHIDAEDASDAVVVGHSMAGHTIPLVAARRPVSRLVYLCSLVPALGASFVDQLGSEPEMLDFSGLGDPAPDGSLSWTDRDLARKYMYADCDPDVAEQALDRLRPQAATPALQPFALDAFPDAPTTYIVATEDRLVQPAWSRRIARDRLGADVIEIPGSHSPFLSRPSDLADVLDEVSLR